MIAENVVPEKKKTRQPESFNEAAADDRGKRAEKEATAFTFAQTVLSPVRVHVAMLFEHQDQILIPSYESDLRSQVRGLIMQKLSDLLLNGGADSTTYFGGLLSGRAAPNGLGNAPATPGTAYSVASILTDFQPNDGLYVRSNDDIRALVTPELRARLNGQLISGTNDTLSSYLERNLSGFRSNSLMPNPSSNVYDNLLIFMGAGNGPNAVCEHWAGGMRVIYDEITEQNRDRVKITINDYYQAGVYRTGGFKRFKVKHS